MYTQFIICSGLNSFVWPKNLLDLFLCVWLSAAYINLHKSVSCFYVCKTYSPLTFFHLISYFPEILQCSVAYFFKFCSANKYRTITYWSFVSSFDYFYIYWNYYFLHSFYCFNFNLFLQNLVYHLAFIITSLLSCLFCFLRMCNRYCPCNCYFK